MSRMTKRNLQSIRCRFEERTGVDLTLRHRQSSTSFRKMWILAAALIACLAFGGFAVPLFSSLDGDELALMGTYEGKGIVSVRVENRSDKELEFQKQTKLMRWVTAEEVPRLNGEPVFENTIFPPHSEGKMIIDLSAAYDITVLEKSRGEWFYLVLTNNDFLFGQDWMCSVAFAEGEPAPEPEQKSVPSVAAEDQVLKRIKEELRFYFQESYTGELMAFNGTNFLYQQKVEELLARFDGTVVSALSPVAMVGGASVFLDPEPIMGKPPEGVMLDNTVPEDQQYFLIASEWTYTDACGRMVASADEKAWAQTVFIPRVAGELDGGVGLPLIYLFVYDVDTAKPENYAFIYGQIYSFAELEPYQVICDEHYAVYDASKMMYGDVDAWLDHFLASHPDLHCDDQIRRRVHAVYEFYQEKENLRAMYHYLEFPETWGAEAIQ